MTTTTIHLLRHGEVDNPDEVLYERLPGFNLSPRGQEMARVVARYITDHSMLSKISHIYASPLERTVQTATPVAEALGLEIVKDDRLIEAGNDFRGEKVSAVVLLKHAATLANPFEPSWGEPYLDIAKRMKCAIAEFRKAHQGDEILVVSHENPIWITRRFFEGRSLWHNPAKRQCELASITSLTFDDISDELVDVEYRTPASHV